MPLAISSKKFRLFDWFQLPSFLQQVLNLKIQELKEIDLYMKLLIVYETSEKKTFAAKLLKYILPF